MLQTDTGGLPPVSFYLGRKLFAYEKFGVLFKPQPAAFLWRVNGLLVRAWRVSASTIGIRKAGRSRILLSCRGMSLIVLPMGGPL
jgi:hypothetical protein